MSSNNVFQFFAITHYFGEESKILRIQTSQHLQFELTKMFINQGIDFESKIENEIAFDGNYKLDSHEIFVIDKFSINDDIVSASKNPHQFKDIILNTNYTPKIKSIFATSYNNINGKTTVFFQSFNRNQLLLKEGWTLLHSSNTFTRLKEEGITLGTNLAAVFKDDKLFFRSFTIVDRFLDVKDYLKEATDDEIREVVLHNIILADNIDNILVVADSWMRKRFAALRSSGILNQIKPRATATKAKKYKIKIDVKKKNGKDAIVFPGNKKDAKQLLAFLNEGYYTGELTDRLYQTNSHRAIT